VTGAGWVCRCHEVYRLPRYASELNPVGPAGSNLKRSLANLTKQDFGQLTVLVKTPGCPLEDRQPDAWPASSRSAARYTTGTTRSPGCSWRSSPSSPSSRPT
jgi:hypothetical protein